MKKYSKYSSPISSISTHPKKSIGWGKSKILHFNNMDIVETIHISLPYKHSTDENQYKQHYLISIADPSVNTSPTPPQQKVNNFFSSNDDDDKTENDRSFNYIPEISTEPEILFVDNKLKGRFYLPNTSPATLQVLYSFDDFQTSLQVTATQLQPAVFSETTSTTEALNLSNVLQSKDKLIEYNFYIDTGVEKVEPPVTAHNGREVNTSMEKPSLDLNAPLTSTINSMDSICSPSDCNSKIKNVEFLLEVEKKLTEENGKEKNCLSFLETFKPIFFTGKLQFKVFEEINLNWEVYFNVTKIVLLHNQFLTKRHVFQRISTALISSHDDFF
ncbi:hypothetical protein HK099_004068, partial [Clydaea vesicula]